MKRLFAVTAMVCLFSLPALAGDIPTMGAPQPQSETSSSKGDAPGDIPTDGIPGDIPSVGLSVVLEVLGFLV